MKALLKTLALALPSYDGVKLSFKWLLAEETLATPKR